MTSSGMVVSPHPLATQAGQAVLDAGGDAISASIAVSAVLCVVCPHFCGLGGDAVWIVSDGLGTEDCFLGIGQGIGERPTGDTYPYGDRTRSSRLLPPSAVGNTHFTMPRKIGTAAFRSPNC